MDILINEWGNLPLALPFDIMLNILGYYILLNVRNSLSNPTHRMTCYWEKIGFIDLGTFFTIVNLGGPTTNCHFVITLHLSNIYDSLKWSDTFFLWRSDHCSFLFPGYIVNPFVRISEDFTVNFLKTTMGQATNNVNWAVKCKDLNENPVCAITTPSFSLFLCLC